MTGGRELSICHDVASDAEVGPIRVAFARVDQPERYGFLVRALLLVRLEIGAAGSMTGLAGHPGVGVSVEDSRMARHARPLQIVRVGEAQRGQVFFRLTFRVLELLESLRMSVLVGPLFLLVMVVTGRAFVRPEDAESAGNLSGVSGEQKEARKQDGRIRERLRKETGTPHRKDLPRDPGAVGT